MDIIISINKPKGITSQDAVTRVKKILKVKKAGHTGTLDPLATGLLLVCVNRATRLATYFSGLDKQYRAVMKLGETTDSQDACGSILEERDITGVTREGLEETLRLFTGKILQIPPMFSALKHKGKTLYSYARKGVEIERTPREVLIRELVLEDISLPFAVFRVVCSKGTYVRTLCHDIGARLGTGAHLSGLERRAIGQFHLEESLSFDELRVINEGEKITKGVYSMDEALSWMPEIKIRESMVRAVIHGNPIGLSSMDVTDELRTSPGIRVKSPEGTLMAVGSYSPLNNEIKMDVVFS
ncbi:MAG: tRNA pseudouridine(55) synthase TruB [Nitrospiraceae bacterium]|nr:MAG: tRNA pseudouridine(55) synthase TruB [Nitrospiraceae bacterium]